MGEVGDYGPQQMQDDQQQGPPQSYPGYFGPGQNPEFLRYLIDNADPLAEIQNELEGKEIVIESINGTELPVLKQTRVPLVNPALRNKIMSTLKTYNMKSFITTNFDTSTIDKFIEDVANSTIDLLETCQVYDSNGWNKDIAYVSNHPAILEGTQQQILLMLEHGVAASLKRSQNALTLNKVTGVHTSSEIRQQDQNQRRGFRIPFFGK